MSRRCLLSSLDQLRMVCKSQVVARAEVDHLPIAVLETCNMLSLEKASGKMRITCIGESSAAGCKGAYELRTTAGL